jgi:putative integral membrane protein (TIGR02587 family)
MGAPKARVNRFGVGLARALGGAVVFMLPLLMTMEMWELGFEMPPARLALLLGLAVPLLVGVSYIAGFEETFEVREDIVDAFVALAVAFAAAAGILALFSILRFSMPVGEVVGKVTLQAVPGAIGALLAQSQLRGDDEAEEKQARRSRERRESSYPLQLLTMVVGALFLAFNVAPTDEITHIALQAHPWQLALLAVLSVATMHAFMYGLEFAGQHRAKEGESRWLIFIQYTVVGYALALGVSLYILWTFGRSAGVAFEPLVALTVVLGFPAAIGAAAARLIL